MSKMNIRPLALEKFDFVLCGTGSPGWGNPSGECKRQFSKHIVWLCRKKPMSAAEITDELNVPTAYVEEELDILCRGVNGKYGLLRRMDNGKYAINFILLDEAEMKKANSIYVKRFQRISDVIEAFIKENEAEYMKYPYLNKTVELNLILWQQIYIIASALSDKVESILSTKYFSEYAKLDRPYSTFGYIDFGKNYGAGRDGIHAQNLCGYSQIYLSNIYISRIKAHFRCGHNVSLDKKLQLAIRALDGIAVSTLAEDEKEHAAKAVECGYLRRDGDTLYTKILVSKTDEEKGLFEISRRLSDGYFDDEAESIANELAEFIKKTLPEYLINEWRLANLLARMPILDALVEVLIEKGILIPPEDGIGAEGCWMTLKE